MTTPFTPAQLEQFRRDAKRRARQEAISQTQALDELALSKGFKNWSLLSKQTTRAQASLAHKAARPATTVPIDVRKRHYLHGDQYESNPSIYYCAECDIFTEASHFDIHEPQSGHERFLSSLARWTEREREGATTMRRLTNSPNILAGAAVAANVAYEASRSPFHRWIATQVDREDPTGDLASDIRRDRTFPVAAQTLSEIQRHLESRRAAPQAIKALKSAWTEFAKQAA